MRSDWRALSVVGVCGGAAAAVVLMAGCRGGGGSGGEQPAVTEELALGEAPAAGDGGRAAYTAAFDAARDVLRDEGFILERVDASAGVITTRAKTTAGILTPWDREQSTAGQEVEDVLQRQQRVVRVMFDRAGEEGGQAQGGEGVFNRMRVEVVVQRVQIPGRKLEPEAIQQSSYWWDPDLATRQMQPQYAVAEKQDRLLAERITGEVRARVGR